MHLVGWFIWIITNFSISANAAKNHKISKSGQPVSGFEPRNFRKRSVAKIRSRAVSYDYRSCCHLQGRKAIVATSQTTGMFTLQQRWSQTLQLTLRHVFEAFLRRYFGVLQGFLQTTVTACCAVETSTVLHCFVVEWAWFAATRTDNDFTSPYCLCVLPFRLLQHLIDFH